MKLLKPSYCVARNRGESIPIDRKKQECKIKDKYNLAVRRAKEEKMRELIERIKNDDVDAVEELYEQVYAKGIKIAASYVGKEGLEEDMFHEAFMKAIGNLDKFD